MPRDEDEPRSTTRRLTREIGTRLDRWDPLGVYAASDGPAPGEYDCMVSAAMDALRRGNGAAEIAAMLDQELVDHFGLAPGPPAIAFAEELRAWWAGEALQR